MSLWLRFNIFIIYYHTSKKSGTWIYYTVAKCRNIRSRVDIQLLTVACELFKQILCVSTSLIPMVNLCELWHRKNNCRCSECQTLTALNPACAWMPTGNRLPVSLLHDACLRLPDCDMHRWTLWRMMTLIAHTLGSLCWCWLCMQTARLTNLFFRTNQVRFTRKHSFYSYYLKGECLT